MMDGDKAKMVGMVENAYEKGVEMGNIALLVPALTEIEILSIIRAREDRKNGISTIRCAECTCEMGGDDCNWIRRGDDDVE